MYKGAQSMYEQTRTVYKKLTSECIAILAGIHDNISY